jgi:hypothetical protein
LKFDIKIEEMRYPEITKNTSTPMKPPGRTDGKAWNRMIVVTAMALKPSTSRRYFPDVSVWAELDEFGPAHEGLEIE